jgi:hypothetical protein
MAILFMALYLVCLWRYILLFRWVWRRWPCSTADRPRKLAGEPIRLFFCA